MGRFLSQHGWEIARLTFEHLWLTGCAMLLAAGVGLPLGVLLTRRERLARPVIGLANVVQTVPSLALFGLLLPVPWLGEECGAAADPSPDRLCSATDSSEYLRRDSQRGSRADRCSERDGNDGRPAAEEGGACRSRQA